MNKIHTTIASLAMLAMASLSANAQGPAPFAGGVKLQQGGVTNPAFGLINVAKQTYSADATLSWVQPTANGILKLTNFAGGAADVQTGLVGLTTDVSGILPIANGGTNNSTFTGGGALYFDGTKIASTAQLANGQLLVGNGSNAPVAATLTAGNGISITNGAGTITIAANANSSAIKQITLSQTAVSYTAQTPPAGFTIAATSVITITIYETNGFPITATVSNINAVGNTFDFVISGYPSSATCMALVNFRN